MNTACYVYAIVGRETTLPPNGNAGGAAGLALVPWRELAAVIGRTGNDGAPLTVEAMMRHEAVVETVRQQGPALPVRFGTVFRDATAVASALAEQYELLEADLDRLGDKVELSLTALWVVPPSGDGTATFPWENALAEQSAGARYLRLRAAKLQREDTLREVARTVADELDQVLGRLALDRRVSLLLTPRVAVRTAYLLEPTAVGVFRAAIDAIRSARTDLRVLLTGPWPPYTFVGGTSSGTKAQGGRLTALAQLLTDAIEAHPG